MKAFWLLAPAIFLAGCNSLPKIDFTWPKSEQDKQIVQLQKDLNYAKEETQKILEEKESEIFTEETSRVSKGTSQVYAAHGTLEADPEPNKYTDAASGALGVAKEALPVPEVEDLLVAINIQKKLLSEQAEEIKVGKELLATASNEVVESKNKVTALEEEKKEIEKESTEVAAALGGQLIDLELIRETERQKYLNKINSQAAAYQEENSFWKRINPLNGLMRTFSSLMFWVVLLVVFGVGLKIASIFFPGVGIIQAIVGGLGRVIGGLGGLLFGWIPDALRGMNAVKYKEYKIQRQIADNSVGSIQELKYDNPEVYKKDLKPKLEDWNKDNPELKAIIAQKLKDLNLV